jgi:uncharacterized protein YbjT (DUF2867 family)
MQRIAVAGATGRVGRHTVAVLESAGYDVVRISRSDGVDLTTGERLDEALAGVDVVIDAATAPSPDEAVATEFFVTASRNLQEAGTRAGVRRLVVVSIIGIDRFRDGYMAAKLAHEREALSGSIPARILRAAQFHEFVEQLAEWGRQGDVAYVPRMQTQLVAARSVAEALADLATRRDAPVLSEIAGPRRELLADAARLLVESRGEALRIEEVHDPADPTGELYASGALLPGPEATLAGPTFEEWLAVAAYV